MDTNLIASNLELVISHLVARRTDSRLLEDVSKLKDLRTERNACIKEGDSAKNIRKTLSKEIGEMMKKNKLDEVAQLKQQVENANIQSALSDEKLAGIDEEIRKLFSVIPNLLDDRWCTTSKIRDVITSSKTVVFLFVGFRMEALMQIILLFPHGVQRRERLVLISYGMMRLRRDWAAWIWTQLPRCLEHDSVYL